MVTITIPVTGGTLIANSRDSLRIDDGVLTDLESQLGEFDQDTVVDASSNPVVLIESHETDKNLDTDGQFIGQHPYRKQWGQ